VDSYFTYNFANNSGKVLGLGNGYFYNNVDDSFTLGLAEVKVTATQGQGSAHVVLGYGQEAALGIAGPGFDVLQAYVSYNPGQWTFNAGKFVTWMGDEVIESNSNWNYSHSLLFGVIPFWHTGLSVNFAPSSSFGITGYVTDGNNTVTSLSAGPGKDYGLQAIITASSTFTITLNGEVGPTPGNATLPNNLTNMTGEGIFVFKPDSMWSFALDAQYGTTSYPTGAVPSSVSYWGLALYGRDQIASDWAVALRLEDLSDSGLLGFGNSKVAGSNYEGTLTVEHNFTPNTLLRVEGRYDTNSYPTGIGTATAAASIYGGGTSTGQFTTTASMVVSY
jgi:Putative beta-barrel porin-2, OmpL-like. bbp2